VNDNEAMRLALDLAVMGEGDVNPNPLVGAVVVSRSGEIVGRGYHRAYGGPHAEVFALNEAGEHARGSTLYVTLEPCCHYGKTPPCTDRIIAAGIASVVFAVRDPTPGRWGCGAAALEAAGIRVVEGVLEEEAVRLNEIFFHYTATGRPLVLVKAALSLDGRIATRTGDSRWISCKASRVEGHRLRRRMAAIAVGVSTVVADDPSLTVRHVVGRDPIPVVLDPTGRIPETAKLLDAGTKPIVVTRSMSAEKEARLADRGVLVWRVGQAGERLDLDRLLEELGGAGIDSLLIEGGGETIARFLESELVDRVALFIAPLLIGGEGIPVVGGSGVDRVRDAWQLANVSVERCGEDLSVRGTVRKRRSS